MHIERFLNLRLAPQLFRLQGLKPGTGESLQVTAQLSLVGGDPENPKVVKWPSATGPMRWTSWLKLFKVEVAGWRPGISSTLEQT